MCSHRFAFVRLTGFCPLVIACHVTGCTLDDRTRDLSELGVTYQMEEFNTPRPMRAHILCVDLSLGKVEPIVIVASDPDGDGPIDATLTNPLKLATNAPILAFINANAWEEIRDAKGKNSRKWYEGQPVDIIGLAASGGRTRSEAERGVVSVWVNSRSRVHVGSIGPSEAAVQEGTAGFLAILREGIVVDPPGGDPHPRTAVGVNRTGTMMWLVVVDGRQENYSEGMNFYELGSLMKELGCWEAANMDGGGSSIMGLAENGQYFRVMNSPSDRWWGVPKVRPLPSILAIREK